MNPMHFGKYIRITYSFHGFSNNEKKTPIGALILTYVCFDFRCVSCVLMIISSWYYFLSIGCSQWSSLLFHPRVVASECSYWGTILNQVSCELFEQTKIVPCYLLFVIYCYNAYVVFFYSFKLGKKKHFFLIKKTRF